MGYSIRRVEGNKVTPVGRIYTDNPEEANDIFLCFWDWYERRVGAQRELRIYRTKTKYLIVRGNRFIGSC